MPGRETEMKIIFTKGGYFVQCDAHGGSAEEAISGLMQDIDSAARSIGTTVDKAAEFNRAPLAGELQKVQIEREKLRDRRDRWRKRAEDAEASLKVADAASDVWKHVADQIDAARSREREETRAEAEKLRADLEQAKGERDFAGQSFGAVARRISIDIANTLERTIIERDEARAEAARLKGELDKLRPVRPISAREQFDRAVAAAQCGCADALQRLPELAMQMMAESRKLG